MHRMRWGKERTWRRPREGTSMALGMLAAGSSPRWKRTWAKGQGREEMVKMRPSEYVNVTSGIDGSNTRHGHLESIQMLLDSISQGNGGSTLIYSFNKHLMRAYKTWHTQTGTRCTPGRVFLPWAGCYGHQTQTVCWIHLILLDRSPTNNFIMRVSHFSDHETKQHHHKDTNIGLCTLARCFFRSGQSRLKWAGLSPSCGDLLEGRRYLQCGDVWRAPFCMCHILK